MKHRKTDNPVVPIVPYRWRDLPRAFWYFLDEERPRFVALSILLFFIFFYDLAPAIFVGKMVDFFTHYHAGESLQTFYLLVGVLGVTYTLAAMVRINVKRIFSMIGHRMRMRARVKGFERLTQFSLAWHAKENSGNRIQRIYSGSLALREMFKLYQNRILQAGAYIVVFLTVVSLMSVPLALLMAFFIAAILTIEITFNKKISRLAEEFNAKDQRASGVFIEGASNMLAIKSLGSHHELQGRVKSAEERTKDFGILKSQIGFKKWTLFRIIDGPCFVLFFLLIGHGVVNGSITLGAIIILFAYWNRMKDMLWDISDMNENLIDYKSDVGNMMPIFEEELSAPTGTLAFPNSWNAIRISSGSFAYPSGQVGMKNFDFQLRFHEKLGVAGTSGSGKSTLIKILLGLYRIQDGSFAVDRTNFYDIAHDELMRNVSVVLQESELFNMTLKDNITMMRELDMDLLNLAIEVSQLREVIDRLPDGVDSLIGEKGYMLSGGERQRLGIARAIYKNAPIMFFDEATSSLDSETERKIMDGLFHKLGSEKTFLIVAHRLTTLRYTDRVIVVEEGSVKEEGTFAELSAKNGSLFQKLNTL